MGSTGSGRFTDYSGSGSSGSGTSGAKGKGSSSTGGASGEDRCSLPLTGVRLQEVERMEYYEAHENVPREGTQVVIRSELFSGRIAVQTRSGREILGVLPTRFNYIRGCLGRGYRYSGDVSSSSLEPTPTVVVDLAVE